MADHHQAGHHGTRLARHSILTSRSARSTLDGDNPDIIVNGTFDKGGAQLELTTPLQAAMFTTNNRSGRRTSTTPVFWQFAGAVRSALAA